MTRRTLLIAACLLTLTLIAFSPALLHPGLPAGTDVELHFWRVFDLDRSWRHGDVLARWSELYYYGYGAPSFQYTAAGFYGLAALVGRLPGVDDVARIKIVWFVSLLAGSLGMYRYSTRRWGTAAGLVSAAALVFAPAVIFQESLLRGSFGVITGIGFAALSLALLDEVITRRRFVIPAALSLALLLLSHNITAVMFAGVIFAWLLIQLSFNRENAPYGVYGLATFAAACGLSAFFWLPLAFELRYVDVSRMGQSADLDYRHGFESLLRLLALPRPLDTTLANPAGQVTIGAGHWVLAIFAVGGSLAGLRYRPGRWLTDYGFWLLVAGVAILLITPAAAPLWAALRPLQTILFPIRFLNVAALALAILAGAGTAWLLLYWQGFVPLALLALGLTGLLSTPWAWRDDFPRAAAAADYLNFELATGILGTAAGNDFLPPDVRLIPPPTGAVIDTLSAGGPVQRYNPTSYPAGTVITPLASAPDRYAVQVTADQPLTLELFQLYFPLWQATIDGEPVESRPSDPYGFTLIEVPAGTHTVEVRYPPTGAQGMGIAVTAVSGLLLTGYGLWQQRGRITGVRRGDLADRPDSVTPTVAKPLALTVVLLVLVIVAGLVNTGRIGTITSAPCASGSADQPLAIVYGEAACLSGITAGEPFPGQVWEVDLYWWFEGDDETPLNSFVHLLSDRGEIVAQHDKLDMRIRSGQVRDTYLLYATAPLPAGAVRLRVGLWTCGDAVNSFDCGDRQTPTVSAGDYVNPDGWIVLDLP